MLRAVVLSGALAASLGVLSAPAMAVPEWTVDREEGRVGFTAWQSGNEVPGEFTDYEADIHFAPDALEDSRVDVEIVVDSVDAGSSDRDQAITSSGLFHAEEYPTARFTSDSFAHREDNVYVATGDLTMRGTTHTVELPFELDIEERGDTLHAVADGEITVERLRWGIGQGQWGDTSMIPNEVRIEIRLVATRPVE